MSFLVIDADTSLIMKNKKGKSVWKTEAAAKSFLTRMVKMGYRADDFRVIGEELYPFFQKKVKRVNLMTGKEYWEDVNTPYYCSPASEAYWSM